MMKNTLVGELNDRRDYAVREREYFDHIYQAINYYLLPRGDQFDTKEKGINPYYRIFDSTGIWALQVFASGLHSYNTSDTDRWFKLAHTDVDAQEDETILALLEQAEDAIYREYQKPESGWGLSVPECYYDIGGYGTGVLYQDPDEEERGCTFKAFPLSSCAIAEDYRGLVDEIYRDFTFTIKQLIQQFGEDSVSARFLKGKKDSDTVEIVHAVFPANGRSFKEHQSKFMKKKFGSVYYLKGEDKEDPLQIGGYDDFPYHVVRWTKMANEIYGRSQGMLAIYDTMELQGVKQTVKRNAEKMVDPPIFLNESSITGEFGFDAGDMIWGDNTVAGGDVAKPLFLGGDTRLGMEYIEDVKQQIYRAFYVDQFLREKKKERQTQYEVSIDLQETLRQMAPMTGRLQKELFSPMIKRTFKILQKFGKISKDLDINKLDIHYTSPAARAQNSIKVNNWGAFLQIASQTAQFDPTAVDVIEGTEVLKEIAIEMDVPRDGIRSTRKVNQIRAQREQQQNAIMSSEMQAQQASASKDLATAQSIAMG